MKRVRAKNAAAKRVKAKKPAKGTETQKAAVEPKLNDQQKLFCREYVKDLNATQAAIRAGYSKKTAQQISSRLLLNVVISAEIAKLNDERFKIVQEEGVDVIRELGTLATIDMGDYYTTDENGKRTAIPLSKIPAYKRRAIKEVRTMDGETVYKFWNKDKALENLGRHGRLFVDQVTDPDEKPLTEKELDAKIADLLRKKGVTAVAGKAGSPEKSE